MAAGENSSVDWNGVLFSDPVRAALAGVPLVFLGALIAIRGDWAEFCQTFGFANWKTKSAPCFACWATFADFLEDSGFGPADELWEEFTSNDYRKACADSEIHFLVESQPRLKAILESLFYDRRQKGGHGRCLRWAIAGSPLRAGDRLEPCPSMPDIGAVDNLVVGQEGVWLVFWRNTQDRVKHNNPIFDETLGVTPPCPQLRHSVHVYTGVLVGDDMEFYLC